MTTDIYSPQETHDKKHTQTFEKDSSKTIKQHPSPDPDTTEGGAGSLERFGTLDLVCGVSNELTDWARLCDAVFVDPRVSRRFFTMSL